MVARKEHEIRLQSLLDLGLSEGTSSWELNGTTWLRNSKKGLVDAHTVLTDYYSKDR
jgi:hypothetical protein